jgi:pimeloyl-ACP methyl ester carboxylesterase
MAMCAAPPPREVGPPRGQFVRAGEHRIFVRQSGAGPDLFLLHGLGDSSLGWQYLEPQLVAAGYRVTVWDALGAGESDKPDPGDYSLDAHRARLIAVMDALGIARAVLVGNSLGGSVALMAAEANPERVQALVLLDPAAYRDGALSGRWFWDVPGLAEVVTGILPARTIAKIGLGRNFHDADAIPPALLDAYTQQAAARGTIDAFIAQERQLLPADPEAWETRHRTIRVPTLILWGAEDEILPRTQGERLAQDIPGATLLVLPGVGHAPQLETPDRVFERTCAFLAQHGMVAASTSTEPR